MGFLEEGFFLIVSGLFPETKNLAVLTFKENFGIFFGRENPNFSRVETYLTICFWSEHTQL